MAAYLNTQSGLTGTLDAIAQLANASAQNDAQLRGLAAGGIIPQSAAPGPGILSRMMGMVGGAQQPASPAPVSLGPSANATAGPAQQPMAYAPSQGSGDPGGNSLFQAIGQTAQKYGIDPMTAIRVAMSEGGRSGGYGASGTGDGGSSFSPFQLHYGGVAGGGNSSPGLGDDFTAATGLDARDPKNALAAIDFALKNAAQHGWSAFHGAAKAGIGQWQGIGGAPQGAAAPMPTATASGPMPPQAMAFNGSQPPADPSSSQGPAVAAPGAAVSPSGGAGPGALQPGQQIGGPGSRLNGMISLPQIQALITNPATRQEGLQLWQMYLQPPQTTFGKPGEGAFVNGRYMGQVPSAPMDVAAGNSVIDPNSGRVIARTAPMPVKLSPGESLVPPQGGAPVASVPPNLHFTDAQGHVVASNPQSGASTDVTPSGVPSPADIKATEGANQAVLDSVTKSKDQAIAASRTIDAINRQQTALDKGTFTGGGAETKLKIANLVAGMFGMDAPTASNTQEFIAAANAKAAELAKQLSNSGHTTNADINMAKIMSGADPNYSLSALREIGRAQQQLALDTINRHNASVAEGAKWNPALAQRQGFFNVPTPTNQYDFASAAAYSNARTALAQGAPRAAVIQRLQQNGLDPSKL